MKLVEEWYSREGVEGSHIYNLDHLAVYLGLIVATNPTIPFQLVRDRAMIVLITTFQMGRSCGNYSRAD